MSMSLKFYPSSIPEPYPGEALSSWMLRVRTFSPEPALENSLRAQSMSSFDEINHPLFSPYNMSSDFNDKCADLDFFLNGTEVDAFIVTYGISRRWLTETFSVPKAPVIPIQFRRGFCPDCLDEAITKVEFPVSLMSWRMILQPFCLRHRRLLHDINREGHSRISFAMDVFLWSCKPEPTRLQDLYEKNDREIIMISLQVCLRLQSFLGNLKDGLDRDRKMTFLMTLLRVLFTPALNVNFAGINNIFVSDGSSSRSLYSGFYERPLKATSNARARSLFLLGVLLGWVDESAAERAANATNILIASTADSIWIPYQRCQENLFVQTILRLFESEGMSVSMLSGYSEYSSIQNV